MGERLQPTSSPSGAYIYHCNLHCCCSLQRIAEGGDLWSAGVVAYAKEMNVSLWCDLRNKQTNLRPVVRGAFAFRGSCTEGP